MFRSLVDIFVSKVFPEHVHRFGGTTVKVSSDRLFLSLVDGSAIEIGHGKRFITTSSFLRFKVEAFKVVAFVTVAATLLRLPLRLPHF